MASQGLLPQHNLQAHAPPSGLVVPRSTVLLPPRHALPFRAPDGSHAAAPRHQSGNRGPEAAGPSGRRGGCAPVNSLGWAQDFAEKYTLGGVLGRGANATVRAGTDRRGNGVAVKIMSKAAVLASRSGRRTVKIFSPRLIAQAREECTVWSTLQAGESTDHIVKLLEVLEDDDYMYFVQERCDGGSFEELLQDHVLSEDEVAVAFRQITTALLTCHNRGIVHRDIKPANFLMREKFSRPSSSDDLHVKMADFGSSRFAPEGQKLSEKRAGTPLYNSPECFLSCYDKRSDLWSAGVLLYQIVTGHLPFWRDWDAVASLDENRLAYHVVHGEVIYDDKEWCGTSQALRDLVHRLLNKNPEERISATETLQHPFLAAA